MANKSIFKVILLLNFLYAFSLYSAEIRIQRPQRPAVVFSQYHFKIVPPPDYKYTFSDTPEQNVKVHRWTDKTGANSVEIRCAKDFVHLDWKFLRAFYFRTTREQLQSVTLNSENQSNILDKWIWVVHFNTTVSGAQARGKLFIMKHKDSVYFITALTSGTTFPPDIESAINSIQYL